MKNYMLGLISILLLSSFYYDHEHPGDASAQITSTETSMIGGAHLLFAGKYGGNISKKEISGKRELDVEGCAKGSRIFQYALKINAGNNVSSFKSASNQLSTDMLNKLEALKAGDSFEFSDVKAYLPNGKDIVKVTSQKFVVI